MKKTPSGNWLRLLRFAITTAVVGCLQSNTIAEVPPCHPLAIGDVDPQFHPDLDGVVRLMVRQTNGQILVTGDFTRLNGLPRKNLARFNPNGSVDTTFAPIINGAIDTLAVQPDNKIVISGAFNEINGSPKRFMARLNPDGSLDPSLDAGVNWNSPGWGRPAIGQMVVQPDGKLLAAGNFNAVDGTFKPGLVRLNANGSLDSSFNVTGISSGISTVALLPTGKMLVGGGFSFSGTANLGLARLNSDGTLDPTFQYAITNSYGAVTQIIPLPDGKFLTGSPIISVGGVTRKGIARMLPNGGLDFSFDPGNQIPSDVYFSIGPVSPDGKVIMYGPYYSPFIRRLNVDGTLDAGFVSTLETGVAQLLALTDGSLFVSSYRPLPGNVTQAFLVRVLATAAAQQELIEFAGTTSSLAEDSGHGEVVVHRSGCSSNAVSVNYALLPGSATLGSDFNLTAGTMHWDANDTSDKTISFQILDDGLVEDAEFFVVVLSNAVGANLGALTTFAVTIQDNERPASQRDPSYQAPAAITTGGFPAVYKMGLGQDGKLLIQGAFTAVGGSTRPGFARLNLDGSVDTRFHPLISGYVAFFAIQPDGKTLVGGGFNGINGISRTNLARLNIDGSLDETFTPIPLPEMRAGVLAVQPDGKVIVASGDGSWNQSSGYILRLNADGSRDSTFQQFGLPDPGNVTGAALQTDGKIVLAGAFNLVGNDAAPGVIRLNPNGSLDAGFNAQLNGLFYFITSVALQPDGKVLVAGGIINIEAAPIVRLNADGSLDSTFRAPYFHGDYVSIQSIRLQPDGKVIVGGRFSSVGDSPRFNVARLNTNGSLDRSFDAGTLAGPDNLLLVYAVELQPDGKVLVGGGQGSDQGQPSAPVIRLVPSNDTIDTIGFATDTISISETNDYASITILRDGNSASSLSVNLNVAGGTATAGEDFVAPATVVTFAPLEVSKTVLVPILDDAFLEPSETIRFALSHPSSGLLNGRSSTTVTIRDNEIAQSDLDTNFFLASVYRALQPDDKILATFGSGLMRYLPDGTPDDTFHFAFANGINTVVPQPDGKVLIGGNFSAVGPETNLTARLGLARFNADGTLDATFNPSLDVRGLSGLALQADGRILLAGISSLVSTGFTRLMPNGQLDQTFRVHAFLGLSDPPAAAVAVQSDGKVLIGGNFYLINGVQRSGIARLNGDGSLELDFAPTVTGGYFTSAGVNVIQPLPDGRIWVGGVFTSVNGVAMRGITRLNADGSLDNSFNPALDPISSVQTLLPQPDGRVIVAGYLGTSGATNQGRVARLNSDGSFDVAFAPALPAFADIIAMGRQYDGTTLLGGSFCNIHLPDCDDNDECDPTYYDCLSTLRLKPDLTPRFLISQVSQQGAFQFSASVVPSLSYILQSSTNLTDWASTVTNHPASGIWNYSTPKSSAPAKFYRLIEAP